MEQPKQIKDIIKAQNTLPTASYASPQKELCSVEKQRGLLVRQRFGTEESFLTKVNPDTQVFFGKEANKAIMGDYPTLNDLNKAYGEGFAADWLIPQLYDLSTHTGAKNLTERQQESLAVLIATEYRHLKVTELLLFFYRFKAGHYGHFYGTVDPMVITCALRDFVAERNSLITACEQRRLEQLSEQRRQTAITYEQWLKIKQQQPEHEIPTNHPNR